MDGPNIQDLATALSFVDHHVVQVFSRGSRDFRGVCICSHYLPGLLATRFFPFPSLIMMFVGNVRERRGSGSHYWNSCSRL